MSEPGLRPWRALGTDRTKSFSDGVFSIVITLLVLELHVPPITVKESGSELIWALVGIWPSLVTYVASFVVVGIYWIAHHNLFHYVHRVDRGLLWLNNLYLMSVSLIAFTGAMLSHYPENKVSVFFYGANLVLVGSSLTGLWAYSLRRKMLTEHARLVLKATFIVIILPIITYLIAMLMAFINLRVSLILYIVVPAVYITPGVIEHLLEYSARLTERRKGA